MDFNLSDEQRMLRDGVQRFVREQYDFESRRKLGRTDAGFSEDHWSLFAEVGWLALPVPEEAGGLGGDFIDVSLLMTELGRALVLEPYVSTAILSSRILARSRLPGRVDLLSAIAEGRRRVALAYLEPGNRYDLESIHTTATAEGGGYRLNGHKLMVLDAPSADDFIVSARLDGGTALFLVPRGAEGLEIQPYPLIDDGRAADLRLIGLRLDDDALIAGPDDAPELLEEALDRAVLAQAAEAIGAMESVIETTAEYLKTRRQFGQAIGKFQALQHRMAEMLVKVEDARSMLYRGLSLLEAPIETRRAAVSATKVVTAEAGAFVGGEGIQLHGGIGVTDEYCISHYFKKLVTFEKSYGDVAWHMARYTG